jgi:hypothetical protein
MESIRMTRRSLLFLSDMQKDILEQQIQMPTPKVGYFQIYRYAKGWDWFFIVVGTACAIGGGAALPLFTVRMLSYLSNWCIWNGKADGMGRSSSATSPRPSATSQRTQ